MKLRQSLAGQPPCRPLHRQNGDLVGPPFSLGRGAGQSDLSGAFTGASKFLKGAQAELKYSKDPAESGGIHFEPSISGKVFSCHELVGATFKSIGSGTDLSRFIEPHTLLRCFARSGSLDGHIFNSITKEAASATPPTSPGFVRTTSDPGLKLACFGAVQHLLAMPEPGTPTPPASWN